MLLSDPSVPRKSSAVSARRLKRKSQAELERIVRANIHDQAVLGAVHQALKGRRRKKAIRLQVELRERLGLDRLTGIPSTSMPLWTRASTPSRKSWYRKWHYVVTLLGFVAIGAFYDVGVLAWQTIHQGFLTMSEWAQPF